MYRARYTLVIIINILPRETKKNSSSKIGGVYLDPDHAGFRNQVMPNFGSTRYETVFFTNKIEIYLSI